MISALAVLPTVLSVINSATPSIEVIDAIYEVNDQGDLTIQVTGNPTGISVNISQFNLKIPEDFEVATMVDGSPIMKFVDNGSAQKMMLRENQLTTVFILQTFNSTLLPINYTFEINSSSLYYSGIITPQWPQQEQSQAIMGGGGASISYDDDPYITSFHAYDSDKRDTEHVITYIHNPSDYYYINILGLRYKIDSSTYNDFNDWTQTYSESSSWIAFHQTYVVHDYLNPMYTSNDGNSRYALNMGTFTVTEVFTYGSRMGGGGWHDYYYPSVSEGEFLVFVEPGTHPVFIAYFANTKWYSEGYSDPATKITEASGYFSSYFWVTLLPISNSLYWYPNPSSPTPQLLTELRVRAGIVLGLTGNWIYIDGTHPDNHGFDVVAGFTGYWSDHVGRAGKNYLVVTGGSTIYGNRLNDPEVENIFQHELSHCYGAKDRWDWEFWYGQPSVMSKPTGLFFYNTWGWIDDLIIWSSRDQFDGVSTETASIFRPRFFGGPDFFSFINNEHTISYICL